MQSKRSNLLVCSLAIKAAIGLAALPALCYGQQGLSNRRAANAYRSAAQSQRVPQQPLANRSGDPVVVPVYFQQPAQAAPQPLPLESPRQSSSIFRGLQGRVKIIVDEQTGKLRVIGSEADIAIVEAEIAKILASTKTEERIPARIPLRYSDSETLAESIRQIYDEEYAGKVGNAEIIPLTSPNALLVFGSQNAINAVGEIVRKIESDVQPEAAKDFATFALRHASAADAKRRLEEYFSGGEQGEAFPVGAWTVVADYRSNTVIVRGDAQVLQQARLLIQAIDIDDSETLSTKVVKVFQLQNAVAGDLTIILQDAITGALKNVPNPLQSNAQGGGITPGQPAQDGTSTSSEPAPSKLQLQTVGQGGKVLSTGVLYDVRITPDSASNSIIVRAPESAMPLIEELIRQLDRLPDAEALIKVFQIVNGDAEQLLTMLESIFGAADQNQNNLTGALAELPLQTASSTPGAALVDLRFAVEQRTNSIIATGPAGDLQVVEDLLNRLDEDLRSRRETVVYRLSNSNVLDVEEAMNELLDSRSDVLANDPRSAGGAVLADQEIVIVPEVTSNSLIISSVPENFPEIDAIIKRLDRRPPMVKVKVLMAEVNLGSLEEFGIELGIQDSLLFDRSTVVGADGSLTGTGFDFNTSVQDFTQASFPGTLAGQALSNLGVGTSNSTLGYGGLVLSAGNESINILMRALKDRGVLRVLSRPHIMTLENLQGRVSVGQIVPRITGTNTNTVGTVQNSIEEREVGVILEITPRVSPDGMITMFVNVVRSSVGSEADGPAVAVDAAGNIIRQAPIDAVEAQTTIISRSGQTTVFSGLIQESKQNIERGTPILSDLPVIGPLFKFEQDTVSRTELLIIMTPYLVDTEDEIQSQNADEMERMHWCLNDVTDIYGSTDFDTADVGLDATQSYSRGPAQQDLYQENYQSGYQNGQQNIYQNGQQNFAPSGQQNFGPNYQQDFGQNVPQGYGQNRQQNYAPSAPQGYQQNAGPNGQQNFAQNRQQGYGQNAPRNFGQYSQQNDGQQGFNRQSYGQQSFNRQSYGQNSQQNYGQNQNQTRDFAPHPQQDYHSNAPQNFGQNVNQNAPQNVRQSGSRNYAAPVQPVSGTESQAPSVQQAGFLQRKKLSLLPSSVSNIGAKIRSLNEPNQNRRNREDFERLMRDSRGLQE